MNKQELIEKIDNLQYSLSWNIPRINKEIVLDLIKQLDEPQKPVVPKYVAKWFEEHKHNLDMSICHVINSGGRIAFLTEFSEFELWFGETLNPIFTLVSMLQFGYTVEKEKRYEVILSNGQSLKTVYRQGEDRLDFEKVYGDLERFTRKQLEDAGLAWVFDCPGVKVKEVE